MSRGAQHHSFNLRLILKRNETLCSRKYVHRDLPLKPFRYYGPKVFIELPGKGTGQESTKVITCSTYEVNVNRGVDASTEDRESFYSLPILFAFPDFQQPHFFPLLFLPPPEVGKRFEEARGKAVAIRRVFLRGFGDSTAFTADSPLIPPALSAPARLFLPRDRSYGNREGALGNAHLLVPSRYLMVRVKSPITQLPRRVHAYTNTRHTP